MIQLIFCSTRWKRTIRLSLAAATACAVALVAFCFALSNSYVQALTHQACPAFGTQPGDYGLGGHREINFETSDGLTIEGWYVPGQHDAAVILLGGIGARAGMLDRAAVLARHGYGVLLFDWRGCGSSSPAVHTLGYRETADLLGAVDYLLGKEAVGKVGVLGFSVGGAVAIRGAAIDERIGAVVAMGNYHGLEQEIYGGGDDQRVLSWLIEKQVSLLFQRETGVRFGQESDPIDLVPLLSPRPLLLIYGEQEEAKPPASGQLLYAAALHPKELWILPGVGHGGYLEAQPAEFEYRIVGVFDGALLR